MNPQLIQDIKDWQLKTDVLLTDSSESHTVDTQDCINLINEARTLLLRATIV